MCDICRTVLKVDKHDSSNCPIRQAYFCSICQDYGHPTLKCPDKETWHYTKPIYVEQLIPSSVLTHYNISTLTPINGEITRIKPIHGDPIIDVPHDDDGKNIRATLSSYNLPCSSVKENKRMLEAYGELIGKKVEYGEPVKRVLKGKKVKSTNSLG